MSSFINNALTGLAAAQRALLTTSNNISNVGTEGYSRQRVDQVQGPVLGSGNLQFGSGAQVIGVSRIYDQLLADQVTEARSGEGRARAANQYAARLEGLLGDPELSLTNNLQAFYDQVNAVANDPTSSVNRRELLSQAEALAQRFRQLGVQLDGLDNEINERLVNGAAAVNQDLRAIARLNGELVANATNPPNSLLDERQVLIDRVAAQLDVRRLDQADGSVTLMTSNGQPLVLGSRALELGTQPDEFDPRRLQLTVSAGGTPTVISRQVSGGEIGGLLAFRDEMLDVARRDLGRIALGVAATFNAQNAQGLDRNGALGGDVFAAFTPTVLPSADNAGGATVTAGYADLSAVRSRDYTLRYDGANWALNDAVTGAAVTLTGSGTGGDPFVADGLEIVVAGAASAGDTFRLRPVADVPGAVRVELTDPAGIAAARPLSTAELSFNVGQADIAPAEATDLADPNLLQSVRIEFDSATTYRITDAGGTPLTGSLAYTSGADISFNGWTTRISGDPATGDVFTVRPSGANSGDNQNALALAGLLNEGYFSGGQFSVQELTAQLTTAVGSFAVRSDAELQVQSSVLNQLELDLESVAGVNLDEEAANLLRYQEAYLASSKALGIANDLFQTVLAAIR